MKDSGLKCDIWIDSSGSDRSVPHNIPRVKVRAPSGQLVPVSIKKPPEILIDIKSKKDERAVISVHPFIDEANEILSRHWEKEITDRQALNELYELAHGNSNSSNSSQEDPQNKQTNQE